MAELNPKQRLFVAEYLKDKNATQAAVRAGYSAKTANEQGSRLLANASIRQAVDSHLAAQEKRVLISADQVLLELKRIALVDLVEAYTPEGKLKPMHEIPADTRRAIVGVEVDEIWDGYGEEREVIGETKKLKMADKIRALELLGKHLKLFTDKIEIGADDSLADLIKEARERKARSGGK